MKRKLLTSIFLILFYQKSTCQIPLLWGMTLDGGQNGSGTIFNILGDGSSFIDLYSLPSNSVSLPNGNLTLAVDGKLYGVTFYGGTDEGGTIYSVDTSNGTVTVVRNFSSSVGGMWPTGSLVAASNGNLYGICGWSDSARACIYSFNPITQVYSTLVYLPFSNLIKCGSLMQASNGLLYGITTYAGIYQRGALISFDINNGTLTVIHDFDFVTGQNPIGNSLIEGPNGKLFGMTTEGGSINKGIVFSYDIGGSFINKIVDFTGPNGSYPEGSLLLATNGLLYGMTTSGGSYHAGVLFSIDPLSGSFTKLFDFDFSTGGKPYGSLIQSTNGLLYGLMHVGGLNHHGIIFSFDPDSYAFQNVEDLNVTSGEFPNGSLTEVNNALYGFTCNGGVSGTGTVFKYDLSNGIYDLLYNFSTINDYQGWQSQGDLTQSFDGKLYGVNAYGGANQAGYIFSYDPSTNLFDKWYDFNPNDISLPVQSIFQCSNGNLYGLTRDAGFIYWLNPFTKEFKVGHQFTNGAHPSGSLIELSNGKLYGTTYAGGMAGSGIIFDYDPLIDSLRNLYDFEFDTGINPAGGRLTLANNGKLYGFTKSGGDNFSGVIFNFDVNSNTYIDIHHFDFNTVWAPECSFVNSDNNLLYAIVGPIVPHIIKVDPSTDLFNIAYDFNWNGSEGSSPHGSLINASDGNLYGMTSMGGITNNGVIFKYDPINNTYTKIHDFDGVQGSFPLGDLVELTMPVSIGENVSLEIIVSPVPTNGKINIRSNEVLSNIKVYNLLGEVMFEVLIADTNNKSINIDLTYLSSGIYFVQGQYGEKHYQRKIIKL